MKRHIQLIAAGKYLPKRKISSNEMDHLLQVPSGWVQKKTDILFRHFIDDETASYMGAQATLEAMERAALVPSDIDCMICASGTPEQPIPCNAALLQQQLGAAWSGIPAYDINSTCLSFLAALDTMSYLIDAGRYNNVLIVSSDIASLGIDWSHKESAALFGDGAAAIIIGRSTSEHSYIITSKLQTIGSGANLSEIRGGGSRLHALALDAQNRNQYLFKMDGPAIFKLAAKHLPPFTVQLLTQSNTDMKEMKLVIPHQGSAVAMKLLTKKLHISQDQLIYITPQHGNTIASSIPMGIYEAMNHRNIARGDRMLLLGTSAGLTLGGMVLAY